MRQLCHNLRCGFELGINAATANDDRIQFLDAAVNQNLPVIGQANGSNAAKLHTGHGNNIVQIGK